MKPIDWSRPVQTRAGNKARVICRDLMTKDKQPVIALITVADVELIHRFSLQGEYRIDNLQSAADLINAPERVERWVNLYSPSSGMIGGYAESRSDAEDGAAEDRLAVIRITYEDGKPVSVALEDAQ
mgnify:CR=1 FL=1